MRELTHLNEQGAANMVDVGDKAVTERLASASGFVRLSEATVQHIRDNTVPKGDMLAVARIAGIQAAKKTSDLIPLCHPLALNRVRVDLNVTDTGVSIVATVGVSGKTGVEMEALTAVSVAALALYDMVKSMDRTAVIERIQLESKSGGKSGDYSR